MRSRAASDPVYGTVMSAGPRNWPHSQMSTYLLCPAQNQFWQLVASTRSTQPQSYNEQCYLSALGDCVCLIELDAHVIDKIECHRCF
jgi:hypothetical protein